MIDKTVLEKITTLADHGKKEVERADDFHYMPRHCIKCGQRLKNNAAGDAHKNCPPMKRNNTTYFSQHIKRNSDAYEYRITKSNQYYRQGIE